jgi:hypothetical protein
VPEDVVLAEVLAATQAVGNRWRELLSIAHPAPGERRENRTFFGWQDLGAGGRLAVAECAKGRSAFATLRLVSILALLRRDTSLRLQS